MTAGAPDGRLTERVDLVVIGGGICGAVCAAEAARRGAVAAGLVVVAAGVWTARLVRPLGLRVPIKTIIYLALAPVLGKILADLALDGRTPHDIAPFRLARFDGPVPAPHRLV